MVAETKVVLSGPLFDGRAAAEVDKFIDAAKEDVAEEGVNMVQQRLDRVLRNPTGFYKSQITTDRARDDRTVTDRDVLYGPWLEGTARHNQTTRFKGYHTFRRTTRQLQKRAHEIAEKTLKPHLARMNR